MAVDIRYAKTYGQLYDEYNYAQAPKYNADFSRSSSFLGNLFSTKAGQDKRSAEADSTRAKAQLDLALAEALKKPAAGGMSTGSMVMIGIGGLALVGVLVFALKKK